jgi:hypothetical protein
MSDTIDTIEVHANVIMTTASLRAIVENMKKIAGQDEKGHVKVDTAGAVNKMISRFLLERDFEAFARDDSNYPPFG